MKLCVTSTQAGCHSSIAAGVAGLSNAPVYARFRSTPTTLMLVCSAAKSHHLSKMWRWTWAALQDLSLVDNFTVSRH